MQSQITAQFFGEKMYKKLVILRRLEVFDENEIRYHYVKPV
jgi:hypothetical protein